MSLWMTVLLTFSAAFFYVAAAYLMKLWVMIPVLLAVPAILLALSAAAFFEIEALRGGRLGITFLIILAFEVILTALCALIVLGESYSPREFAGLAIIIVGIGVLGRAQGTKEPEAAKPFGRMAVGEQAGRTEGLPLRREMR